MQNPDKILKQYWGYDHFRPLQREIIQAVLEKKDVLALLPTGGGKSLCFQVPALTMEGLCIVVSPLIALMKDQVQRLTTLHIPAKAIFSGMSFREIDITLSNCVHGAVRLLYVSPERLATDLFKERLKSMRVNLLAVDEAHCISQWGYEFRPAYREIATVREILPDVHVLALTATATRKVQDDIVKELQFGETQQVFRKSFARENISWRVYFEENKPERLLKILKTIKGSGIVYVRSRKGTKELSDFLVKHGESAGYYHAGLNAETRGLRQKKWLEGSLRVMVCTNAFGMGIDKSNVRVVAHLDLPESLEAYYQEAGRAGRDDKQAFAVTLYDRSDLSALEKSVTVNYPDFKIIRNVYQALAHYFQVAAEVGKGHSYDFDLFEFSQAFGLDYLTALKALKILEENGYIVMTDAVLLSPRIFIKADRTSLYDFEIRNPGYEPLIKLILRSHPAVLDQFVRLKFAELAKRLKITREELNKRLSQLDRLGIVDYEPVREKAQLMFLEDRAYAERLVLDKEFILKRRDDYKGRIGAMIRYISNDSLCRMNMILEYFGEKTEKSCGHCDICYSQRPPDLEKELKIRTAIEEILTGNKELNIRGLTAMLPGYPQKSVLKVIREMMDSGLVRQDSARRLIWKT